MRMRNKHGSVKYHTSSLRKSKWKKVWSTLPDRITNMSTTPPANKFDSVKSAVNKFLHQKNTFTDILGTIEKTVKVKREYMFYGAYITMYNT